MSFRSALLRALAACVITLTAAAARGQNTVPAVLLSDIHFDPFHNPHLLPQLRALPIERWPAILDSASGLVQDADSAALQLECRDPSVDTPWSLLKTSLAAAHDAQPHPVFVTLSGDLLAHQFSCRFHHEAPTSSPADLSIFAAKTLAFVASQLKHTFPGVPVYVALGNNDSGCGDYRESAGSPFMQSFTSTLNQAAPARPARKAEAAARLEISPEGDYSLALPPPLRRGRLIVLQDVFESVKYGTCSSQQDRSPETNQVQWLRAQLAHARARHEQVWFIGHIPPGLDVYSSLAKYLLRPREICSSEPRSFLAGTALADALLDYADIVRLAIFAHTHMDEIRLLHRPGAKGAPGSAVAVKLVPSITPYFGNHPAFMVADIEPATLILKDWETFVSPSPMGSTPPWPLAYRFSAAYHLPDFSASSAAELADGFTSDPTGRQSRSSAYRQHFYPGDVGLYAIGLEQLWPAYACSVREHAPAAFHQCLCPAAESPEH